MWAGSPSLPSLLSMPKPWACQFVDLRVPQLRDSGAGVSWGGVPQDLAELPEEWLGWRGKPPLLPFTGWCLRTVMPPCRLPHWPSACSYHFVAPTSTLLLPFLECLPLLFFHYNNPSTEHSIWYIGGTQAFVDWLNEWTNYPFPGHVHGKSKTNCEEGTKSKELTAAWTHPSMRGWVT